MIVIKETGSPYFDCAYFVLRCDLPDTAKESDMLKEAGRLIGNCVPPFQNTSDSSSDTIKKTEPTLKKRAFILIALLCAVVPTAATIGIFCLLI